MFIPSKNRLEKIAYKYRSFDTSKQDDVLSYPNLDLVFPPNIKSVTIITVAEDGSERRGTLVVDDDGKGFHREEE